MKVILLFIVHPTNEPILSYLNKKVATNWDKKNEGGSV